jgi:succinate dehydrogenase / fumarate reductase, cytochrome b subunit
MLAFYRSTVGKKIIMAVTGVIGIAFVIVHMAGNLQLFAGREKLNNYAALLHGPLYEVVLLQRVVLVVAVALHVLMAWQLALRNRQARPVGYQRREPQVSTWASRTMRWGGVFLLVFIVLHILHFTTLDLDRSFVPLDAYGNLVRAFTDPWMAAFYLAAMIFLGLHLFHGAWSSARTLGVAAPTRWPLRRKTALVIALLLWAGFSAVPVAILLGVVR